MICRLTLVFVLLFFSFFNHLMKSGDVFSLYVLVHACAYVHVFALTDMCDYVLILSAFFHGVCIK